MRGHRKVRVYEDSGEVQETEVYLPNIRNVIGFLQGVWDFDMYRDCFHVKGQLGDNDASVELYGNLLMVEFKRNRSDINFGQTMKAIRCARLGITTIVVFGETNRPVEYLRYSPNCIEGTGFIKCDIMALSNVFRAWSEWSKKNDRTKETVNEDWKIAKRYMNAVGKK